MYFRRRGEKERGGRGKIAGRERGEGGGQWSERGLKTRRTKSF